MHYFSTYTQSLNAALNALPAESIDRGFDEIWKALETRRTVYVVGNGGSASTASHMACDLGKGACVEGKPRLKIMSLNDNVAHFSALANDFSYADVFVEQLKNLIEKDDLLIGISASGNSPNVVGAFELAKEIGAVTIGLVGFSGGRMKELSDVAVHVDIAEYGPAEDAHLIINHVWTDMLRAKLEAHNSD